MSIVAETKRRLAAIRSQIEELRAEGRHDEALAFALATIESFGDQTLEMALKLAALARERAGRRSERIDPAQRQDQLRLN